MRRSISSCVSPTPRVPIPPACRSRCDHWRVSRGSMYSSCASSTCVRASRLRARPAKMSRISALRSMTLVSMIFSRLRVCAGESSSSKTISETFCFSARRLISSAFPLPIQVAASGAVRLARIFATTTPPAVSINFSSSSRCSSATLRVWSASTTPTAITCSGTLLVDINHTHYWRVVKYEPPRKFVEGFRERFRPA